MPCDLCMLYMPWLANYNDTCVVIGLGDAGREEGYRWVVRNQGPEERRHNTGWRRGVYDDREESSRHG